MMLELLAAADPEQLLPARQQMAFTLGFHIVLVPFGVAFTFLMLLANWRGLRRGTRRRWCWRAGGRRSPACSSPSVPSPAPCSRSSSGCCGRG
ncbi:hypothetical protein [Blastococcus brunescens]|uniref:Cytochrome oxidase subunit I profile domain-containing protein n=1 Tax=Blastococcus brunescens TaxID=1564165 RepID=A0ABZ1ATH3_9ACTN|nr:hypothetical protein [Blastococcus sp. BMG 8361]WRL61805.1 hypothetical protein U6N30_16900 [Blastococcus sp. BMG 8361]